MARPVLDRSKAEVTVSSPRSTEGHASFVMVCLRVALLNLKPFAHCTALK